MDMEYYPSLGVEYFIPQPWGVPLYEIQHSCSTCYKVYTRGLQPAALGRVLCGPGKGISQNTMRYEY